MGKRFRDREEFIRHIHEHERAKRVIRSDLTLIFHILKEIVVFLVLLIPRLLGGIFFLFVDKQKSNYYFRKIFYFPRRLYGKVHLWFFQAKITSSLILILFVMFIIQGVFLNVNTPLMQSIMTHPNHFFEGNYHSVLTSVFLHANLVHLLTNSIALLIFGRIVEKQFRTNTIWIFLASGAISNIISNAIAASLGNSFYSLGASGAIAGLIIFAILLEPFYLSTVFLLPLPIFVIGWFLIIIDIIGLTNPSQVNHLAHIGGYSALLFLFFFLGLRSRRKIVTGFIVNLLIIVLLVMISQVFDLNIIRELIWI